MRPHLISLLALAVSLSSAAEIRLPHVLSDHGVLQRNQPVRIWGWASPAEIVTVSFHGQTVKATADSYGAWEAWLRPESAGGPYTLAVSGDKSQSTQQRTDILVGDVWIASGQSNMEFPLKGFTGAPMKDSQKEIAAANHPNLRMLLQKHRTSAAPMADQDDVWAVSTPKVATNFSAVAYFFARRIQDEEKGVPIGLIDTTWGGTPAHSWISQEGIAWSGLTSVYLDAGKVTREQGIADAIKSNGAASGRIPGEHGGAWAPSTLFNAMIAPYVKYTIKGAIWYQGETDHEGVKALNYSRVFPALIQDWRKQWAEGEFPFLYVQISSFDGGEGWAAVRDAQRRTLELGNTGMAVTLDVGLEKNVHPPDKQTVGARLAQTALDMVYGTKIESASPLFVQATPEDSSIRAWFSHADGLMSHDSQIGDFEVAGADGKFAAATAKIEKVGDVETVVASAGTVAAPRYIRYAWTPVVHSYLYNSAGLPMGTFTSISDAEMLVP